MNKLVWQGSRIRDDNAQSWYYGRADGDGDVLVAVQLDPLTGWWYWHEHMPQDRWYPAPTILQDTTLDVLQAWCIANWRMA